MQVRSLFRRNGLHQREFAQTELLPFGRHLLLQRPSSIFQKLRQWPAFVGHYATISR
jgi:hypothetical protein